MNIPYQNIYLVIQNNTTRWDTFLPFLIAFFMAYVAYQQWQTNERKRKFDLYNRRYDLFNSVYKMLKNIDNSKSNESNDVITQEISENLGKYQFLIKPQDYKLIMETCNIIVRDQIKQQQKQGKEFADNYSEFLKKKEENLKKIGDIMEFYLRIENENLIEKIKKYKLKFFKKSLKK